MSYNILANKNNLVKQNKILSHAIETRQESLNGLNWLHRKTIVRETNYRQRKMREAQEIKKS